MTRTPADLHKRPLTCENTPRVDEFDSRRPLSPDLRGHPSEVVRVHAGYTNERDDAARALVVLYDERCRLTAEMARTPTGAMAQAVMDKGTELDAACEAFRRRFYPRKAEVFVGLWKVMAASKTRRSVTTALDLFDEYHTNGAVTA